MALDMMAFTMMRNLSEKQDEYNEMDSEGNLPLQFTHFIEFAALFFKTFHWVDMKPLIIYVLNRLNSGDKTGESFILSNILTNMSGWKDLEITQLNDKQLQCLAGGLKLKIDIMEMSAEYKKAKTGRHSSSHSAEDRKRMTTWSTSDALSNLFFRDVDLV